MIKENRIVFGSGDVYVCCTYYGLCFTNSSESYEIGTKIERTEIERNEKTTVVHVKITDFNDLYELKKLLESVKISDTKIFKYNNYVFDFSNFNVKSVDVVLEQLGMLPHLYMWISPLCS